MAAITITAANVRPLPGAVMRRGKAGEDLTVGQFAYLKSDGEWYKADADADESSRARGMVVAGQRESTTVYENEYCDICVFGPVTGGASMTPGDTLFVSTTAGSVDHTAPAAAGDYPFAVGWAESASEIFIQPQAEEPTVNT